MTTHDCKPASTNQFLISGKIEITYERTYERTIMGDALVRALASEVNRLQREEVEWKIVLQGFTYNKNLYNVLIQFPHLGTIATLEFSLLNSITVDKNDQILFDQLEPSDHSDIKLVAITFNEDQSWKVIAFHDAYGYVSMQYNIAKAISREIVKFATQNGMNITRVDKLSIPEFSVYKSTRT